jgi:hypothetical protein
MKEVFAGRYTAKNDRSFVVFVIGMRINHWWKLHKWLPVFFAMPPMLKQLSKNRQLGMAHYEQFFRLFPINTLMISYWDSFETLDTFARNPNQPHLKAWSEFMKRVGSNPSVGIFHETYVIPAKNGFECVYGNMPRFGLAAAFQHAKVASNADSAKSRILDF